MNVAETFSITQFEQLSGIKAHTLRIWETRYQLFSPSRSITQLRRYTLEDFERLLNIALLNKIGYKISRLASLNAEQIKSEVLKITDDKFKNKHTVHRLLVSLYSGGYSEFTDILDKTVLSLGIDATIDNIIIPFLEKIDLLSYKDHGTPTHFVVGAVRNKLIAGIETPRPSPKTNQYALLLLPEGDHYDLILLYNAYQLKRMGIRVLYLGTNVPFKNLKELARIQPPFIVVSYLPCKSRYNPIQLIDNYKEAFPHSIICLTRPLYPEIEEMKEVRGAHIHYSNLCESLEKEIKDDFASRSV